MAEKDRLVALRMPAALVQELESVANRLSVKEGKRVSLSACMRRAIELALPQLSPAQTAAWGNLGGTKGGEEGEKEKPGGKRKKIRSRRVPEGLTLSKRFREAAGQLGIPEHAVAQTWAEFKDTEFNTPRSDWLATWRNFCRRHLAWGRVPGVGRKPTRNARDFEQLKGLYDE